MVLVVLAVSTVLVVLQVVDPNDYKPQISALVEEKTGRRLDLAGDLQLTFFPWVGIETGPLSLSNAEGFGDVPMISADNARIRVKLLPLIKRRVEAGTVVLDAPVVHLLTAVDGRTNWDDLAGMGDEYGEERAESEPAALAGLAVQGVSVTDGRVVWRDAVAGNELILSDLDLSTGMLVPGEPLDVTLSLDAAGAPLPGPAHLEMETTVTLSRNMSSLSLGNTGLILSADTVRAELGVEKVSYALEAGLAAVNGVVADVEVDGIASRLTMPSLNLNLSDETLAVPSLELTQEDTRLAASFNAAGSLTPEFEGEFSIRSGDVGHLLRSNGVADVELPATYTDVDGAVAFAFREDELQLLNLKLAAHVDGLPTQLEIDRLNYHLRNESLALPAIRVRQEDFRLDASLNGESLLSGPSARRLAGRVDLALNDVEELLIRNGLPVTPPLSEIPLSEIRLVGGISLEGSAVTANSVVAEFVYRGQETRVDVSSLALDPASGKLDLAGFRFQQDGFDLSGRVTGDRVFDGVAGMDAGETWRPWPETWRIFSLETHCSKTYRRRSRSPRRQGLPSRSETIILISMDWRRCWTTCGFRVAWACGICPHRDTGSTCGPISWILMPCWPLPEAVPGRNPPPANSCSCRWRRCVDWTPMAVCGSEHWSPRSWTLMMSICVCALQGTFSDSPRRRPVSSVEPSRRSLHTTYPGIGPPWN